jgi:hypothetical protein
MRNGISYPGQCRASPFGIRGTDPKGSEYAPVTGT